MIIERESNLRGIMEDPFLRFSLFTAREVGWLNRNWPPVGAGDFFRIKSEWVKNTRYNRKMAQAIAKKLSLQFAWILSPDGKLFKFWP